MTNQDLNEQVARKLGWTIIEGGRPDEEHYAPFNVMVRGEDKTQYAISNYCGSIQAAWIIVEKMRPDIVIWDQGNRWIVSRSDFQGIGETLAEADTAPMAIVKAFLRVSL